ncbi:MAG: hydrogenase formation protein HypD [Rubripirellula sp.]
MKFLDEYRDAEFANDLIKQICATTTQRWVLMDVCGGQTHNLVRSGIETALQDALEIIHGPGCPVCVTPSQVIDFAIALSHRPNTILTSFGDMLRVPGSHESMLTARSAGGDIRAVYSPIDALKMAIEHPSKEIVFLGVGFETTAPATALALLQAERGGIQNFSIIPAHVRVQPAMEAIVQSPDNRVQAFLAAGHVCTITGYQSLESFSQTSRTPIVVTGFEPIDLLDGILHSVRLLEANEVRVVNRYARNVQRDGNVSALQTVESVYEVGDRSWRGFGNIPSGALVLREDWKHYDASEKFAAYIPTQIPDDQRCRAADVMAGRIKPMECEAFGRDCTPESPLGAPMVSSEGACAAYARFQTTLITPLDRPE